MSAMILRSMRSASVEWIPDGHLLHFIHNSTEKSIVNGLCNKESTRRNAILSFVEENGTTGLPDDFLHVRVSEDYQRRLSAQFKAHLSSTFTSI